MPLMRTMAVKRAAVLTALAVFAWFGGFAGVAGVDGLGPPVASAQPAAQPAASSLRNEARAIWKSSQDAVVTAQVVIKMNVSMGGRQMPGEEIRNEVPATIIDAGGLAVVSLTSIDPTNVLKQLMPQGAGMTPEMDSSLSEAKMRLADGREIAVEVVLRDADLDLAFLRPTEAQEKPLPFVDLSRDATLDVLDEVVVLSRMRRVADWAPGVVTDYVRASVSKPRPFLILSSQDASQEPGHPVFARDGRLAGILAVRSVASGDRGLFAAMSAGSNILRIVIPTADVREVAKQAIAKK